MKLLPEPPQHSSSDPLYNIGVVTRMTGISMATLRAWERRYEFPEADRTDGGHRLYSESDILRLRWVKERIDEGMQTAQAIQALRHQETQRLRATETSHRTAPETRSDELVRHPVGIFQENLLKALLHSDLDQAERILGDALAVHPPETLITGVISPAMRSIGEAWEEGRISVAVEHLGTNYLRQRLLMWMASGPPPLSMPPVLLACAPDEWHEGSLLILGSLLRRQRIPVAYLGQAVPLTDLASFVQEIKPSLVVLVAMTAATAANLADWPAHLPEDAASGKPKVCFGGRAFARDPELARRTAGAYLGDTLEAGLQMIDGYLQQYR